MKIFDGLQSGPLVEKVKCPQCSSEFLETSTNIDVPEWQPGKRNSDSAELLVAYNCTQCGHRFTSKDIEERKKFKQGIMTLFFIFIIIVLLLLVLL